MKPIVRILGMFKYHFYGLKVCIIIIPAVQSINKWNETPSISVINLLFEIANLKKSSLKRNFNGMLYNDTTIQLWTLWQYASDWSWTTLCCKAVMFVSNDPKTIFSFSLFSVVRDADKLFHPTSILYTVIARTLMYKI